MKKATLLSLVVYVILFIPTKSISQTKQVLYINQDGVDPGDDASVPSNDPIINMLNSDENFQVTYIETPADGSAIPDLSAFDLIIAQENISSGAQLYKPGEKLAINMVNVPLIYSKTSAFRNGRAITDADAVAISTQNLAITVETANQNHPLFSGIDFSSGNDIKITNQLTNGSGADPGDKSIDIVNNLEITPGGTLLATVPEVTDPEKALVVNYLPAGTQLGTSEADVLNVDAIILPFLYGPLVYENGVNITDEGLTIWRNAAYLLTGLEVPEEKYFNPALFKKILYVNQSGVDPGSGGGAIPGYDPIVRMLQFEEYFEVTYVETPQDGSGIPDLNDFDLVIAQETLSSDAPLFMPDGVLGIKNVDIPIIYGKAATFRNGRAVSDGDATTVNTQNLSVTVGESDQGNELFNGIDFSVGNTIPLFFSTAGSDGSDAGDKALEIVNGLNISTAGTLLATVPEVTDQNEAVVINYFPAGTQLGDNTEDVLQVDAVALAYTYGAIAKKNGANLTDEGLTIWRNAAYKLTGLTVPTDLASNPAFHKQVLYVNQRGVDPGSGGGSEPENDPIIRMLESDANFEVTYVETQQDGDQVPDPGLFDLVIVQETMSSGADVLKPTGVLGIRNIQTPVIFNKAEAFRNNRAVSDTDVNAVNTQNLSVTVPVTNQDHPVFSGIDFTGGNDIRLLADLANGDGSAGGDQALTIINDLNISTAETLLATVPEVTNSDEAIVINYFPEGTVLGENTADVLGVDAFAFAFRYGPLVSGDGGNVSSEALTIWRNAAYILTDLEVPDALYVNPDYSLDIETAGSLRKQIIAVRPNPTSGLTRLTLQGLQGDAYLSLFNLSGQQIWSNTSFSEKTSIDLTDFPSGIYLLKVSTQSTEKTVKILKR